MIEFFAAIALVVWGHRFIERRIVAPALDWALDRIDGKHEHHTPADHHLARYHR